MFQGIAARVRAFVDGADARAARMGRMAARAGFNVGAALSRPDGGGEALAARVAAAARTCAFCPDGDGCARTLDDPRGGVLAACPNLPFFEQAAARAPRNGSIDT